MVWPCLRLFWKCKVLQSIFVLILSPGNNTDPSGLAYSGERCMEVPGSAVLAIPQGHSLLRVLPLLYKCLSLPATASSGEAAQVCPGWLRGLQNTEPDPE